MLQGCANQHILAGQTLWKSGAARCSKKRRKLLYLKDLYEGGKLGDEQKLSNKLIVCVQAKSDFHNYFHNYLGGFPMGSAIADLSQES